MYSNFNNLPEEKKKKILDACIDEFAQNGYINASTNTIVKKAGISKGILFHYFGNKKNLYLYIIDYIIDYAFKDMAVEELYDGQYDIFDKILELGIEKLRFAHQNPLMQRIFFDAFVEMPDELKDELQKRQHKLSSEMMPGFLKGIDRSKFRKDVDMNKSIELIMMAADAIRHKYVKMYKGLPEKGIEEFDGFVEDFKEYISILKHGVYERE